MSFVRNSLNYRPIKITPYVVCVRVFRKICERVFVLTRIQASKTQQTGFTLIELVMVIVILGILSAFALPRFAEITGDAKRAKRDTLIGAIDSTIGIAKAVCLAQSTCSPSGVFQSISIDGQRVSMLGLWPMGTSAGILTALDVESYDITTTRNTILFTIGTDCTVQYHHPLHRRAPIIAGDSTCS